MRKLLIGSILVLGLNAQAQFPDGFTGSSSEPDQVLNRGGALVSTLAGVQSDGSVSQLFTDEAGPLSGYANAGADDFIVPAGERWEITRFLIQGTYFDGMNTGGPAESVNVYIIPDNGAGLPDSTNLAGSAIYAGEELNYSDIVSGDFDIPIPGGVVLPVQNSDTRYWLVVQANQNYGEALFWFWKQSTTQGGDSDAVWYQSAAIINGNVCVNDWGTLQACGVDNATGNTNLAFAIEGNLLGPGANVDPTTLVTTEDGSTASYSVSLTAPPVAGATVNVAITSQDVTEGTVAPASLDFTAANWDVPQDVTVTPGASGDGNDGNVMYEITHLVSAPADAGYDGAVPDPVDVTNNNIDGVATIIVDPTSVTADEGGMASFTITVGDDITPTMDVSIDLTNNDTADYTVDTATAVLTAGNGYSVTVNVTGVSDDLLEGPESFTLVTGSSTSGDPAFNGVDAPDVTVNIDDANTAGVNVAPSATPISGDEDDGALGTITYTLNAEPLPGQTVVVDLSSGSDRATVAPTNLLLTNGNWDTGIEVTVTAVDDDIDNGTSDFQIIAADTTSNSADWEGLPVDNADVQVSNDGDTAGISSLDGIGPFSVPEDGQDDFDVTLDSEPTFPVDITFTSDTPTEALLGTAPAGPFSDSVTLTFTPANWDAPQTVYIEGVEDGIRADGDQAVVIDWSTTSGDNNYDGDAGSIDVTVTDIDPPCLDADLVAVIGDTLQIFGTPNCELDVYDCSTDPSTYLGTFTLDGSGFVDTGILVTEDACYEAFIAGTNVGLGSAARTVPTLGEWGLIAMVTLLMGAAVVSMRRRRMA